MLCRFLFEHNSEEYKRYREMVEKRRLDQGIDREEETFDPVKHFEENESVLAPATLPPKPVYASIDKSDSSDSDTEYMREAKERNLKSLKYKALHPNNARKKNADSTDSDDDNDSRTGDDSRSSGKRAADSDDQTAGSSQQANSSKRVKRSRWGEKVISPVTIGGTLSSAPQRLSTVTRSDPNLLKYAMENFGSINLEEDEWTKAEEAYKVNLLYQDMVRKRQEIDQFAKTGKFKYEYDSDEDVKGKFI